MLLQHVTYQVFAHEVSESWPTEPSSWHQMDGQIVLAFAECEPLFVSWGSGPVQYSIEQRSSSFFSPGLLMDTVMTLHPYWNEMIGKHIQVGYEGDDHQVLKVSCDNSALYVSSQYDDSTFRGDCVRVSKTSPL